MLPAFGAARRGSGRYPACHAHLRGGGAPRVRADPRRRSTHREDPQAAPGEAPDGEGAEEEGVGYVITPRQDNYWANWLAPRTPELEERVSWCTRRHPKIALFSRSSTRSPAVHATPNGWPSRGGTRS